MRLRRFIYRHPAGKALYEQFLATLKPKNQAFLSELIRNLRTLEPKERVRLHRLERAFWRFVYQQYALQKDPLPTAVEIYIAQELGQIGLYKDAFRKLSELRRKYQQDPLTVMQIELFRYRLLAKRGTPLVTLQKQLKALSHPLHRLKRHLKWQKIQLRLFSIMQREGGSFYTEKTKIFLEKLKSASIWQAKPLDETEAILAYHTKGLLSMLTGDWEAAEKAYEKAITLSQAHETLLRAALLNRWQLALYRAMPAKALVHAVLEPLKNTKLTHPSEKAVLLHHLARTAFLYGRRGFMQSYFRQLEPRAQGLPYPGETAAALASLAWGAGLQTEAFTYYEQAKRAHSLEARIEAHLGQLLSTENFQALKIFQKTYRFLLRIRSKLLVSEFLISILKVLSGLDKKQLHLILALWEARLAEHPHERALWVLTPLPLWLQSVRSRCPVSVLLSLRPLEPKLDSALEALLALHFRPSL